MAKTSPPTPVMVGSTTARTHAAVTAASIALPPAWNTWRPAAEASGWLVAMTPFLPSTVDRVPRGFPAGRSPGSMKVTRLTSQGSSHKAYVTKHKAQVTHRCDLGLV